VSLEVGVATEATPASGPDDAAMAEKFNNQPQPQDTVQAPTRAEGLPENFNSVEDLAKSYKELQAKFTKDAQEPAKEPEQPASDEQQAAAKDAVEEAGLNFDAFSTEYADKGELSEATYKALEDGGIPKSLVDQFIAGQTASETVMFNKAYEIVGGEETYTNMQTWAVDNLSEAEMNIFNEGVTSGNSGMRELAIRDLHSKFKDAGGVEPSLVSGNTATDSPGLDIFRSAAEMTTAMKDRRYGKDVAYTKDIEQKVIRSRVLSSK
jgi:hypothetical protein